jgi:hypothetical protein
VSPSPYDFLCPSCQALPGGCCWTSPPIRVTKKGKVRTGCRAKPKDQPCSARTALAKAAAKEPVAA